MSANTKIALPHTRKESVPLNGCSSAKINALPQIKRLAGTKPCYKYYLISFSPHIGSLVAEIVVSVCFATALWKILLFITSKSILSSRPYRNNYHTLNIVLAYRFSGFIKRESYRQSVVLWQCNMHGGFQNIVPIYLKCDAEWESVVNGEILQQEGDNTEYRKCRGKRICIKICT